MRAQAALLCNPGYVRAMNIVPLVRSAPSGLFCLALGAGFLLSAAAALAAVHFASAWEETPYSRARLVAGAAPRAGALEAGVEIEMEPGWKTYWRVPGESGVPPEFDFSGSANLASARVLWPAPRRYRDRYGITIGYKDKVVFPLVLDASDPARPVRLRLALSYAVCRDICLPAQASLSLDVGVIRASSPHGALIARFRAQVPRGPKQAGGLRVASAQLERGENGPGLLLEIDGLAGAAPEIFVEGPADLYFGGPKTAGAGTRSGRLYRIPVDGLTEARRLAGERLRVTVVDGDRRLQQAVRLD